MKGFDIIKFIERFTAFSPRQLCNETKAADYMLRLLNANKIDYIEQKFLIKLPAVEREFLLCDGKNIKAKACSFVSGKIENNDSIISSLISARKFLNLPNINFNPKCDNISLSNFYFAPALAVSKKKLPKILNCKKIFGEVKISHRIHKSKNILVGNVSAPKCILFAHYDSLGKGAIDNASGTAVLLHIAINNTDILKNNLLVFSGCEELSYDNPVYWGKGYRIFEKKYISLMEHAMKILVVDSVGNGKPAISTTKELLQLAFAIKNLDKLRHKIFTIYGNIEDLMSVYHSDDDIAKKISRKQLMITVDLVMKLLKI